MKKTIHLFTCIFIWFFFTVIAIASQPLPDTGQTICYNEKDQKVSCDSIKPGDPYYGQDVHYQPRLPRSYTKLGYGGAVLADDALHVDDGGPWIMNRDNVTGLIWELKREDGLQSKDNTYSWYDPNPETNEGDPGFQDRGNCTGSTCDTHSYIQALNTQNFGGFSDWRMPEIKELSSMVNRGVFDPAIDTAWFPKTVSSDYWSSTPGLTYCAWLVYFNSGSVVDNHKSHSYYVRAVRSGHSGTFDNFIDNGDGTVTDTVTGLMWQKEVATGEYNWQQALAYAENLTLAGYSDWRLPNINELQTLVDHSNYSPAIYPVFRPHKVSSYYWSSTTYANYTGLAWLVYFYYGYVGSSSKSNSYYVRAVRSGQSDIGEFGSLVVHIEPQAAIDAGAQWRRKGTSTWYDSGYTETSVPIGNYIVEFKEVPGWRPEGTITVIVEADKTVTGTGSYFEQATGLPGVIMLLLDE